MLLARLTGAREAHLIMADRAVELPSGVQNYAYSRRLDQGPKGRAERPSLHEKRRVVETRSLRSALRAPVETTDVVA